MRGGAWECGATGDEQREGEGGHERGGAAWPGEWGVGSAASAGGTNDMDWRGLREDGHAVPQSLYGPIITMGVPVLYRCVHL